MRCLNFWDNKIFWGAKSGPLTHASAVKSFFFSKIVEFSFSDFSPTMWCRRIFYIKRLSIFTWIHSIYWLLKGKMLGNFLAFIVLLQIISNNCILCNANPKTDPKQQKNKKVYSVTKKSFLHSNLEDVSVKKVFPNKSVNKFKKYSHQTNNFHWYLNKSSSTFGDSLWT